MAELPAVVLARLVLQSDLYAESTEVRIAVNEVIATAEPAERVESCSTCGGSQTVRWGAEDKWQSLPCPNCSPEAKAPAQPPASGEPPELPADWREAVAGALAPYPAISGMVTGDVLTALAPLVLAERLRAERLRRALRSVQWEGCSRVRCDGDGCCPQCGSSPGLHRGDCSLYAALYAEPPDAALAELAGLSGRMRTAANQAAASKLPEAAWALLGVWVANLDAVLAKLGLPAGEEAGDG